MRRDDTSLAVHTVLTCRAWEARKIADLPKGGRVRARRTCCTIRLGRKTRRARPCSRRALIVDALNAVLALVAGPTRARRARPELNCKLTSGTRRGAGERIVHRRCGNAENLTRRTRARDRAGPARRPVLADGALAAPTRQGCVRARDALLASGPTIGARGIRCEAGRAGNAVGE